MPHAQPSDNGVWEYENLEDVTMTFGLPQAQPLRSGTFGPAPFLSQLKALRRINIIVECKDRSAHPQLDQLLWSMLSFRPDLVASIVITGEPLSHLPDGLRHFTSLTRLQVSMDWWGQGAQRNLVVAALGMQCRSLTAGPRTGPAACAAALWHYSTCEGPAIGPFEADMIQAW